MANSGPRAEAERLLGISEKLLISRDFTSSRDFAILAQENEPLLDGSDQILAVTDVLLASEKRVNNKHHDWYSILQINPKSDDLDLIKKQYRRLALLLHPDKNKYAFADHAFKFVADAWAVLSDPSRKAIYDNELSPFSKVNLVPVTKNSNNNTNNNRNNVSFSNVNLGKMPVRRSVRDKSNQWRTPPSVNTNTSNNSRNDNVNVGFNRSGDKEVSFWTACPYCYVLYEYPKVYEECCLRCQICSRGFHAAAIKEMPPLVPGKEAYYLCWGFFPLGFTSSDSGGKGFPNWMPNMFGDNQGEKEGNVGVNGVVTPSQPVRQAVPSQSAQPVRQAVSPQPQPLPNRQEVSPLQPQPVRQAVPPPPPQRVAESGGKKKRGRPRKYPL